MHVVRGGHTSGAGRRMRARPAQRALRATYECPTPPAAAHHATAWVPPRSAGDFLDVAAPPWPPPPVVDARHLPELRAQLTTYLEGPVATAKCRNRERTVVPFLRPSVSSSMSIDEVRLAQRDRIAAATLFAVSAEMVAAVRNVSASRADYRLHADEWVGECPRRAAPGRAMSSPSSPCIVRVGADVARCVP
jgi:hypothetical protein